MNFSETVWKSSSLSYDRVRVMGILNITPDSFSDGGMYTGKAAEERIFQMVDEGADIIDIGGESTRPGFTPVSEEEELERIIPLIKTVSSSISVPISVDTMKPSVAKKALDSGASIINDVGGLQNDEMVKVIADNDVAVVAMHIPAEPHVVHRTKMTGDVISEIREFLFRTADNAISKGIKKNSIIIDPGIGFGKTMEQNIHILRNIKTLCGEYPVLVGASRKRFLAPMYPSLSKDDASIEAVKVAISNGVSIVRVHDVSGTVRVIQAANK